MYAIAIVLFALTAAISQSKPDENGIHLPARATLGSTFQVRRFFGRMKPTHFVTTCREVGTDL